MTNLKQLYALYLDDNNFQDTFMISTKSFPASLAVLSLDGNYRLSKIDIDESFSLLSLDTLRINGIDDIFLERGLCDRNDIEITPQKSCDNTDAPTTSSAPTSSVSPSMAPTTVLSFLEATISSVVENNDFSSYNQNDFDIAQTWFLNPANHPTDMKGAEYMNVRPSSLIMF